MKIAASMRYILLINQTILLLIYYEYGLCSSQRSSALQPEIFLSFTLFLNICFTIDTVFCLWPYFQSLGIYFITTLNTSPTIWQINYLFYHIILACSLVCFDRALALVRSQPCAPFSISAPDKIVMVRVFCITQLYKIKFCINSVFALACLLVSFANCFYYSVRSLRPIKFYFL